MSKYRLPAPVLAPSDYVTRGPGEAAKLLGNQFHRNAVVRVQRTVNPQTRADVDPQKREKLASVLQNRAMKAAAGGILATKVVRGGGNAA